MDVVPVLTSNKGVSQHLISALAYTNPTLYAVDSDRLEYRTAVSSLNDARVRVPKLWYTRKWHALVSP